MVTIEKIFDHEKLPLFLKVSAYLPENKDCHAAIILVNSRVE